MSAIVEKLGMKGIYRKIVTNLQKKKAVSQALILISFLFTFLFVRIITHLQKAHIIANQNGPLHIHHMVPGIILLLISGFIGISFWSNQKIRYMTAVFFGVGAALTIDEFSLWLFLQDVYWAKQGRDSVDAVIIVIIILVLSLLITETHMVKFKRK